MSGIKFDNAVLEYFKSPINAGMLAMLVGIVLTPIITLIVPAKDNDRVNNIFACYYKKVTVSSKKSINEDETEDTSSLVKKTVKSGNSKKTKNKTKRK